MKQLLLAALLLAPAAAGAQALTNSGTTITVQSGAMLYVAGAVQNTAGSTLTSAGTVQLTGDLTNAGTLASVGTLLFSGTTDQTFTPGPATVSTLMLSNTGAAGANRLFLANDLTVSSLLTLAQGLVRTQVPGQPLATLSLPDGAVVANEAAGRYVQGRLAVTRAAVSPATGPVDFSNSLVLDPNGQNLGAVTVTRTAGLQAAGVSYGQNVGGLTKGIDRVWQVVAAQPPGAATPASATVSWVADDDNGFNASAPAQLWRASQASGPWVAQGTPATAGSAAGVRSFAATPTQLGTLTVSNVSAPLPVTLVAFTAERQGTDGLLSWTTASELHNNHFEVESSGDGLTFQILGRVAGAGTSSLAHHYQLLDKQLTRYAAALVYYRLRQVDADGTATYSPVRTLAVPPEAGLLMQAYPNPSAPGTTVALSIRTGQAGPTTLLLTDVLGRAVGQRRLDLPLGTTTLPLPEASPLAAGVYLLHVQQGGQQQTLKLVRHD